MMLFIKINDKKICFSVSGAKAYKKKVSEFDYMVNTWKDEPVKIYAWRVMGNDGLWFDGSQNGWMEISSGTGSVYEGHIYHDR